MPDHVLPDAGQVLASHPGGHDVDLETLARCVAACTECAAACVACSDACLSESGVADLVDCIRTDLLCADLCATTGRALSRRPVDAVLQRALVETCATVCAECARECGQHAEMHDHCRACAEACRRCEQACRQLLAVL